MVESLHGIRFVTGSISLKFPHSICGLPAGRPINKLVLLCLVGQLQIYGGNFKLIGHVITYLARILSSSSNISVKDPMTMKFFTELEEFPILALFLASTLKS